ncbi:MAG TPA: DUF5994 family protein [Microlunatus sp.]
MSGYTTHWERRPAFDDDGTRSRTSATLAEAQLIMKMAFVVEPGFRAVGITDTTGRHHSYELTDPRVSEQEYLNHGFDDYDNWSTRATNEPIVSIGAAAVRHSQAQARPPVSQAGDPTAAATPGATITTSDPSAARATAVPRLQLKLIMVDALLDGAWWPRSRDLRDELPSLADHWPTSFGRIVRVLYAAADWDASPRRIFSRGTMIPASSFPYENSHKIIITLAGQRRRLELLVIPPDTTPADARLAFAIATDTGNRHTATQIITGLAQRTISNDQVREQHRLSDDS